MRQLLPLVKKYAGAVLSLRLLGFFFSKIYRDKIPYCGIQLDVSSRHITNRVKARLRTGLYESAERRLISAHLPSDQPVIELGSSIGAISSVIAGRLDPGETLICVEPSASLLPTLEANLKLNASHLQTRVLNAAIAYEGQTFEEGKESTGGKMVNGQRGKNVPIWTLARVIDHYGVVPPFSLCCDIEGSEISLILKDSDSLRNCSLIVMEVHGRTQSIIESLDAIGLYLIEQDGQVLAFGRSTG